MKHVNEAAALLGRLGGLTKSGKRAKASSRNGTLGGRPKHVFRKCRECKQMRKISPTMERPVCRPCKKELTSGSA